MPVQPTYPGVYVQEVPSGVRTIMGVSTSTAVFVGRAKRGRINEPVLCTSLTDFEREFSMDASVSEMPQQVRLFFENGGTRCYAMRITNGTEVAAEVTLKNEAGTDVLKVKAKQAGADGNLLRVAVTYSGQDPEIDFNMEIFRYEIKKGQKVVAESETFKKLSMDDKSLNYVKKILDQNSKLVNVEVLNAVVPNDGFSLSGRPLVHTTDDAASFRDVIDDLFGVNAASNEFNISVDNFGPVHVNLSSINVLDGVVFPVTSMNDFLTPLKNTIRSIINSAIIDAGGTNITVTVDIIPGPVPTANQSKLLKISSEHKGDVRIFPSASNDLAAGLMLGTAQGGLEVGAHANLRPAPTGISFKATQDNLIALAEIRQVDLKKLTLTDAFDFDTTGETRKIFKNHDPVADSPNEGNDGVREKLRLIRDAVNDYTSAHQVTFPWKAELSGYRLTLVLTKGDENKIDTSLRTEATNIAARFTNNVRYYSLGNTGLGSFQGSGAVGIDGAAPDKVKNYEDTFDIIEKKVDLFNLLLLPRDKEPGILNVEQVYGKASTFCQKERAFLIMDAPDWGTVQNAQDGIAMLRIGLVKDHSAIYHPKIKVRENGTETEIGPGGAIAGIMARTDSNRGVWKAPAGTEADIRGISGIKQRLTDNENGVLNPRAINTIRAFPNGIVVWGARTMDGDDDFQSEYKYIPVRRLALFMEESLYRGLKWVVFEPNDEPLWAQIRLNVGAFMHDLFRQGAFQGVSPKDAYFVKCDKETTTQSDINQGVVNIWVGFAPLKPAEFVILHIQQVAGNINV
jgi:uncharacterized protein